MAHSVNFSRGELLLSRVLLLLMRTARPHRENEAADGYLLSGSWVWRVLAAFNIHFEGCMLSNATQKEFAADRDRCKTSQWYI